MTYYVGAISGTSVDSLDLAMLSDTDGLEVIADAEIAFELELQQELISLASPGANEIGRLGHAHAMLGEFIGKSISAFIEKAGVRGENIRAVGSHGQTVRHSPNLQPPYSIQIGDASRIAEITGIDTIADFRSRDIAAGGQGAPLVPLYHLAQFTVPGAARAILNIGGIANVTLLDGARNRVAAGFDTGPGNALLDAWTHQNLGHPFDHDAQFARTGRISQELLDRLLAESYLRVQPPKSTGKELFNASYIENVLRDVPALAAEDVAATLCELSARSIADAILRWCQSAGPLKDVIVCGGGRRNPLLMERLEVHMRPTPLLPSETINVAGDSVEAAAFAFLAKLFVERKAGNDWSATGARGPRILGCLYPGS